MSGGVLDKKLTIKERKFLKEYFRTGNGTQSALKVYNCKSPTTAATLASEKLRKLKVDMRALMEARGLSLGQLIDTVKDATQANKIHCTDNDFIETPDHQTRLKAVEIASKWLGVGQSPTNIQVNTFNLIKEQKSKYGI